MKKIGLTGGIGVGKTYISKIFKHLGYPIFNSDVQARECLNEDNDLIYNIRNIFGSVIFKDGKLQKKELANIVFKDIHKLDQLNKLVHPIVKTRFRDWCNARDVSLVIKEAAILFESNSHLDLDAVICVSCPEAIRIERVKERDQISKSDILNRINNQMSQNEKEKLSDFIIINDDSQLLLPQIINILKEIE
tara:strand:- start:180 stop:755 length:576 start_codon:yes stop_codon:yes gene_type:complete